MKSPAHPVIGFDAKRLVRNATGLGNYGRTLVNDLAMHPLQLRLYAPDAGRDDLRRHVIPQPNVVWCHPAPSRWPFSGARWRTHGILADLQRDGVQLYHGLTGELPVGIRSTGIRSVVTIHDLIFLRHPEYYHWLDTRIYAWKFRQALREADRIIAISECTRRDILHYGHISPDRVSVIYQSCAPRFVVQATSEVSPSRYILSVGSIEQRKNILLVVQAIHRLPADIHLYIVGRHTRYADVVRREVERSGLSARVHILHDVTDAQLPALYAGAEAFVYPSRYEGFGIPIIEAISCGLPVVACTGSCLEEAGGPDSLYVDPDDAEAMAAALQRVLKGAEGREERIRRSRDYILRFAGDHIAQQVIDLYQEVLGG